MTGSARSIKWRAIAGLLFLLALGAGVFTVLQPFTAQTKADDNNDNDAEGEVNPPARLTMKNGTAILTLSAADQQNAGIMTAPVLRAPAQQAVTAFATVLDSAPLADLNGQYIDASAQVQAAEAKLAISKAAYERAKLLFNDHQNISTAQLQTAQSSFESDNAALGIARSRLAGVAATARLGWGDVLGSALVDHAALINDLLDRRRYLVKVTLAPGTNMPDPPKTANGVHGGADIALSFVSLATGTDPKLQGVSYFYSIAAENGVLPGLNLDVTLAVPVSQTGVIIPGSAVVWLEEKAWIYVRQDAHTFVRRAIDPTRPAGNDGYVVTSLAPGAEIVVQGAQMLLSEEFRAQVPVED